MKIIKLDELTNFINIEKLVDENGKVFIKDDDSIKYVIMNIDRYNELIEAKDLLIGLNDYYNNNVINGKNVDNYLKDKYNL